MAGQEAGGVTQFAVIPGRCAAANPESSAMNRCTAALDSGFAASGARNDGEFGGRPLAGFRVRLFGLPWNDEEGYSAAWRASMRSTRAAQYLNSGIFPNGSSAGLVKRFAAAST